MVKLSHSKYFYDADCLRNRAFLFHNGTNYFLKQSTVLFSGNAKNLPLHRRQVCDLVHLKMQDHTCPHTVFFIYFIICKNATWGNGLKNKWLERKKTIWSIDEWGSRCNSRGFFLLKENYLKINIRWCDQPNKAFHSETATWGVWAYERKENTFSMAIHLAQNEQIDYI